jgi:hypothetical protein
MLSVSPYTQAILLANIGQLAESEPQISADGQFLILDDSQSGAHSATSPPSPPTAAASDDAVESEA